MVQQYNTKTITIKKLLMTDFFSFSLPPRNKNEKK